MIADTLVLSNRCRPLAEWPQRDQVAWAVSLEPGGLFNGCGVAAGWCSRTKKTVIKGYGRWLTWADERSFLDPLACPGSRVTKERLMLYMADLEATVTASTVAARVEQLGNALRAMAPKEDWHWLQTVADRLRGTVASVRPGRERIQSPPQPVAVIADALGRSNRCRPFADWPHRDQLAWAGSLETGGLFHDRGVAAGWSSSTRDMVIKGYGRWLTWADERSFLDPLASPGSRVTEERLVLYLADLTATVAGFTVATLIEQLGNALRAMASTTDWRWIQRAADRLRSTAVPVRRKRQRVQPPHKLEELGRDLMAAAEANTGDLPAVRAVAYRDGLLIAFLAHRPIRRRSLGAMQCDRHLVRRGSEWWVLIEEVDTKTGRMNEFPFPERLADYLERYLDTYRPFLLSRGQAKASPVTGLWVSAHGTQMGLAAITHQVLDRTKTAFGESQGVHMFRDSVATGIAIDAPAEVHLIPPLLSHTDLTMAQRHYNLAGSVEAGRRFSAVIDSLRDPERKPRRRRANGENQ